MWPGVRLSLLPILLRAREAKTTRGPTKLKPLSKFGVIHLAEPVDCLRRPCEAGRPKLRGMDFKESQLELVAYLAGCLPSRAAPQVTRPHLERTDLLVWLDGRAGNRRFMFMCRLIDGHHFFLCPGRRRRRLLGHVSREPERLN